MGSIYKWGGITDSPAETPEPTPEPAPEPASNVTVGEGTGTIKASGWISIPLTREQLLAGVAEEEVAGIRFTTDTQVSLRFYYPDDGMDRYPWKECGIASSYDMPVKYISLAENHFDFSVNLRKEDSTEHTITWQILREGEIEAEPAEVDVTTVTQEEAKAMYTGDYSIPYSFNPTDIALNSNPVGEFYGNNTIYFDFIGLEGYDSWQVAAVAVYENGEYEVIDIYTSMFSGAYGETNEAGFMDVKGSESTYMRLQYDASVFETEGVERVGIMVYGMVPVNVSSYQ